MNYFKKQSCTFLLLLTYATCNFNFIQSDDSDLSTYDLDEFDNFFDESGQCTIDKHQLKSCEPGQAAQLVLLLSTLQAPELLNDNLYRFTTVRPNARNVLNYPNFFIFHFPEDQVCRFYLFYNQGFKMNYASAKNTKVASNSWNEDNGKRLDSYLNIENPTTIAILEEDKKIIGSHFRPINLMNIPAILNAFGNAFLEERRISLMFHYFKNYNDKTTIELKLPFLYEIHNLNFTPKDKQTLQTEFAIFGQDPNFDETKFGRKHMVMDGLGTGTLDFTIQHLFWESQKSKLYAGLALYFPTDYRWVSGLYGTYHNPKNDQPILDLCDIVDLNNSSFTPNGKCMLEKYFLSALNHLSSAILQCPLGYNNHMAFAFKLMPFWQWKENVRYSGMYIFEWLLPHEQQRFFINKLSKTPFSEQFASMSDNPAQQLNFFEATLTERLFPQVIPTLVHPGFLLNTISNLQWTVRDWNYTIGYNWWYQTKEKLTDIQTSPDLIKQLDVCKATIASASQVKLYAKIHKDFQTKHHDLSFAFYGNVTVYNDNVGDDFLLGISFDKKF